MPAGGRPRDLKPGDSLFKGPGDAAQWSTVAQTVRSIRAGNKPGRTTQGGGGSAQRGRPSGRVTIGIIDGSDRSPDDGWPDFSGDNRYWVRIWTNEARAAHGAASPDVIEEMHVDSIADYSLQVPATNLAERRHGEQSEGSHLLADGTIVTLWQVVVGTEVHWVFWQPVEDRILARITGHNSGTPTQHSWEELQVTAAGTMAARSDGEERAGTHNAYEFNGREAVPKGTIVWIDRIWDWANDAETFWFDLAMGEDAPTGGTSEPTRFDLTFAGEHQEGTRGDATKWHIEDQGANRGVKIRVPTGEAYYHDGDETWYEYFVTLEFDANGHLWSISAEGRVAIDVPEDCAP